MKSKTYNSKPVKAATKNMAIHLKDVTKDQLEKIFDATHTKTTPMKDVTGHKGYSRYHSVQRTGQYVDNNFNFTDIPESENVVNILGSRYSLTQHSDVFHNVIEVLDDNGVEYTMPKLYVDQREGRNRIYGNLTLDEIKIDVDGSKISPTIDIFNSTDGMLPAGIIFGAYRFKCENGMLVGNEFSMQKMIHVPSIINKLNFGKTFEKVVHEFEDLRISIEKMQDIKINDTMLKTLGKMGFNNAFIKNYPVIIEKYLLNIKEDVKEDTLWAIYATATNFISNHLMLKNFSDAIKHQRIIHNFMNKQLHNIK